MPGFFDKEVWGGMTHCRECGKPVSCLTGASRIGECANPRCRADLSIQKATVYSDGNLESWVSCFK